MNKTQSDLAQRLIQIIEDTEGALADAACESRAVGELTAPDELGPAADAMSALESVEPIVDTILDQLARAREGLEKS